MAVVPSKVVQQSFHRRWPVVVGQRKGFGATAFRGGGGALMVRESIDEVLQLREGIGEVRHGPKGADEGAQGSSLKGREMAVRRSSQLVRTRGQGERGRRVMGCSGVLAREDERGKKWGVAWW
jgi:hypothetical protein